MERKILLQNLFPATTTNQAESNIEDLFKTLLMIFVLAEHATVHSTCPPWFVEEKLNNRRTPYTFDNHLQQMCMYVGRIGFFDSRCIPCGASGFHRTELYNNAGTRIHLLASVDKETKYLQSYFEKNTLEKLYYFCFKYQLMQNKKQIMKLKLIAPIKGQKSPSLDLTIHLEKTRSLLLGNSNINIQEYLNEIKKHYIAGGDS